MKLSSNADVREIQSLGEMSELESRTGMNRSEEDSIDES